MAGSRARIAFYDAYASLEGSGMVLREIIRRLDDERFEPLALLPRDGPLTEALVAQGCPVEVLVPDPPLDSYGGRLLQSGAWGKVRSALALARYSLRVASWLRRREVVLLHCNQTRSILQAGPGGRLVGARIVWNVRIRESLPWYLARLAGRAADRIITLTDDSLDDVPGGERLMRRATVIPNAVDLERFHPSLDGARVRGELGIEPDAPVLLSIGVMVPRKGHDVLVAAMPEVLAAHPDARLLIAGGPPEAREGDATGELRAQARQAGVEEAVELLGWREDIPELIAACDVFALASRREGQPGAVLEAMAEARPVVVTPPAAAGVEDGRSGLVVPGDDPDALARAVIELLDNRGRARAMGRAGRERVERHHDVRAMVRAYERVYLDLLEGG